MSRRVSRVVFFEPYPHLYGGGQRSTHLLASALIGQGWWVTVITPAIGAMTDRLSADAIPWLVVPLPAELGTFGHRTTGLAALRAMSRLPIAWVRLAATIRHLRPDIIHATNVRGAVLAGPVGRALRIPVVWHVHQSEARSALNRLASGLAARVVIPSPSGLPGLVGVRPERVIIIPNGVTPEAFKVDLDRRASNLEVRSDSGPTLVTAARLIPEKGLDVLVEAIPLLLLEHPDLLVIVFGAPQEGYEEHYRHLAEIIAERRLGTVMTFAGDVRSPFCHYANARIYVQPSRSEVLPLAILEAMAVGLPIVASDVGGVSDLVEHGRTGLLVPPDDPPALAGAIHSLLVDPDRAAVLGRAGADKALAGFSVEVMTKRWQSLYDELQ